MERKTCVQHRSSGMVLDELEYTFMTGFDTRTKKNVELNCFSILASYCGDIPEGEDITDNWYESSERNSYVPSLKKMIGKGQLRHMDVWTTSENNQTRAIRKTFMLSLPHSSGNVTTEEIQS